VQHRTMSPVRILVIEDEPLIRMYVADCLADAGFHVDEAENAREAIEKIATGDPPFNALIIDVGLPDRPGDVLAGELRTKWPDLPILIASGHDRNQLARRFKEDGRIEVLAKPFDSGALLEALDKLGISATG
jgi:DNA-binding response OmpR family regulator